MLYLDVDDLEKWAEEKHLKIIDYVCPKCGNYFKTTVPFIMKGYVGLESPIHGCGQNFKRAIMAPTSKDTIDFWKTIV